MKLPDSANKQAVTFTVTACLFALKTQNIFSQSPLRSLWQNGFFLPRMQESRRQHEQNESRVIHQHQTHKSQQ